MAEPQPPKGYENYLKIPEESPNLVDPPKGYEKYIPYKDPITSVSEKVAPFAGRMGVEALPAIGSLAGPGGTLVGTGISQMMKRSRPDLFGEQPQGADAVVNAGKELLLNNVLPAGLSKLGGLLTQVGMQGPKAALATKLSNFPAVREGYVKNLTSGIMKRLYPESGVLETGAENATNRFGELTDEVAAQKVLHPLEPVKNPLDPYGPSLAGTEHLDTLAAMDHLSDVFGKNKVGQMLVQLQKELSAGSDVAGSQTYKTITNTTLSDLTHVRNAKLAAGPQFTDQLAWNKLLTGGFKDSTQTIDAAKVLDELGGKNSEIYAEALSPKSQKSLQDLLGAIKNQQEGNATDSLIRYSNHKLIYTGAGTLIGGMAGHATFGGAIGLGASSVLPITNSVLRRLMSNPETAQIVTQALRTSTKAPEAGVLNKMLSRILQGGADLAATPDR